MKIVVRAEAWKGVIREGGLFPGSALSHHRVNRMLDAPGETPHVYF